MAARIRINFAAKRNIYAGEGQIGLLLTGKTLLSGIVQLVLKQGTDSNQRQYTHSANIKTVFSFGVQLLLRRLLPGIFFPGGASILIFTTVVGSCD
jgi:hypothetical protein